MEAVKERAGSPLGAALPDQIRSDAEYNAFSRELDAMSEAFAANDMEHYDDDRFRAIVLLLHAYYPPYDAEKTPPTFIIRNEAEFDVLRAEYDALSELNPDLGTPEFARKEYLFPSIYEYEQRNFRLPAPDPIDVIKARMDELGLRPKDLAPYLGSRSRVSEVLHHKRKLTVKMITALHKGLDIPLEDLMLHEG